MKNYEASDYYVRPVEIKQREEKRKQTFDTIKGGTILMIAIFAVFLLCAKCDTYIMDYKDHVKPKTVSLN